MGFFITPIGLYRCEQTDNINQQPYVLLKPKEDTIVLISD